MLTLYLLGAWVGSFIILWHMYSGIMNLKRARDNGQVTTAMKVLGYPALAVGLLWDFLVNVISCTILFMDIPREYTMTSRLIRYKRQGTGWRCKLANWFCSQLLDALDPSGCHCKV